LPTLLMHAIQYHHAPCRSLTISTRRPARPST
jgi:hypothetical protein